MQSMLWIKSKLVEILTYTSFSFQPHKKQNKKKHRMIYCTQLLISQHIFVLILYSMTPSFWWTSWPRLSFIIPPKRFFYFSDFCMISLMYFQGAELCSCSQRFCSNKSARYCKKFQDNVLYRFSTINNKSKFSCLGDFLCDPTSFFVARPLRP